MAGLTVGDDPEWEDIKKEFVSSGDFSKRRITAIQRLTKECAVGMDEAEETVDRWGKECRGEMIQRDREVFTTGDVLNKRLRRKKK
jgi:hypothetical protein